MDSIFVYKVEYPGTTVGHRSHRSYEFLDAEGNILLKPACQNAFVRPLDNGKPVKRSLHIGDIGQVLFGKGIPEESCMRGITYRILEVRELPLDQFVSIQVQAETEHNTYTEKRSQVEADYAERQRLLHEEKSHVLPPWPESLERRLLREAYGANVQY